MEGVEVPAIPKVFHTLDLLTPIFLNYFYQAVINVTRNALAA